MRRLLLFASLLITTLHLHAQRELANPLIDSKKVIAKGIALHDAGEYKAAISEYLKVPPSDTSYSIVLQKLILSYCIDSNFVEAEKFCTTALSLYPEKYTDWYLFLSHVYDNTQRGALAIKGYDTIIAQNPYYYLAYYNKAVSLFRQARYDEATINFQRSVILNPYYTPSHYFLGQLALMKGNMVQAMLSFATSMMINPGNNNKKNSVGFLQTIAEVNTTATQYLQKYKAGKDDNFDEVQEILVSKVALDKKYKLKAELEDIIVRQLQVVMEKLEYNPNDRGFWMQYYVPLFKNLWDNKHFEPLVFYMFSELDIKKIKDYTKKEKNKVEAFSNAATGYLNEIRESQELFFTKRENSTTKYLINNYSVSGKGTYGKNLKNEKTLSGAWEFYYENGRVKSKGNFDNESERNGEWNQYHENGLLYEISNYADDLAMGTSRVWHDNGLLYSKTNYNHDRIDGEKTTYYYSGRLASVVNYKAGKKEGVARYYSIDGYLKTVANYINDLQEGEESLYHANGKLESVVKYVKDMPVGEYREYFDNAKLKESGNYTDGKKTGVWTSYFIDGKVSQQENYLNGELDGAWISYYSNGNTETRRSYRKGEIDGKTEDYDEDGILFCETVFEKGRLRDIKFFDKKGTVISNTTSRKGNADITFYDPDGIKVKQGYYSKDGLAEGKFTYYFMNGQVSSEVLYKNGLQDGKKIIYYANKKISQEGTYKDDKANGYFLNYYNNGQVSEEGWYVDDQRQGTFIYYNMLGTITSKVYYLNDQPHGISEYFTISGKPEHKEYYDHSWFNKIEQYDSTGKIMVISELNKGQGKVQFNHFNGKRYFESNYKYYKLNGAFVVSNGDESKVSLGFYKNGKADSVYTSWYPNGKIKTEGQYTNGEKTGNWKYYYYNGKLSETEHYANGQLEGLNIEYNEQGMITKERLYKNGDLQGATRFYGDNGQLMMVFYYKNDDIQGYSYEDKNGKLLPMIPMPKGTGVVESFYKNGAKSAHILYNAGVQDGKKILYSANGNEMEVSTLINGLETGVKKIYYPSGKIKYEENYYYGELHGVSKYYSEDGMLIYDRNYYLDHLHGDCKYYTAGKLTQTYTYYDGELESKK